MLLRTLTSAAVRRFFGLTSDTLITEVHFGLSGGGTTGLVYFVIDNVTIGTRVPEPSTLALLGFGIAGIGYQRRKRLKA